MRQNIAINPDEQHLNILAICHYALAATSAFAGCIPLIHVSIGIAMLTGGLDGGRNPPPREVGIMFVAVGGSISIFVWTVALLKAFAGRSLSKHKRYGYCYAIACLECLQMPMGTALGIFTIVVLNRPSVKAMFAGIPYRDPRMDALDAITDDEPAPNASAGDDAIREGPAG